MTSCLASWNKRSSRFLPLALSTPLPTFSSLHPSSTLPYVLKTTITNGPPYLSSTLRTPQRRAACLSCHQSQALILSRSAMSTLPSQIEGVLLRADIADRKIAWFEERYKLAASTAKGRRRCNRGQGIR